MFWAFQQEKKFFITMVKNNRVSTSPMYKIAIPTCVQEETEQFVNASFVCSIAW